jgi:DNA-binding NarL/FixJ family response regulator
MMKGDSNKVICRELRLAESTVKNQVTAILKALNVTSRTQAVLAVTKLGLALPAV